METQIVGYETIPLEPDAMVLRGTMFMNVSKAGLDLQAIKMSSDVICDGNTKLWWWNGKFFDNQVGWCPACDEDGDYINEKGEKVDEESDAAKVWGDGDWIPVEKNFDSGESFFIQLHPDNTSGGALVPAGALITSDATAEKVGFPVEPDAMTLVTDPMPVSSFTLKDVSMDDDTICDGNTKLWWWNGKFYDNQVGWCPACDEDGDYINEKGEKVDEESDAAKVWGDGDWIEVVKEFTAGEGFWIQLHPDNEEAREILFKNPLYKAN